MENKSKTTLSQIVHLAATDLDFRRELQVDPTAAFSAYGLKLTNGEGQLAQVIASLTRAGFLEPIRKLRQREM